MSDTSSNNRRREDRLPVKNAAFTLNHEGASYPCSVVNVSRLGLGIELAPETLTKLDERLVSGATVEGELSFSHGKINVTAAVRVRRGGFLGLEYEVTSVDFLNRLRTLLSPGYIASTINEISPKLLSGDTEKAFRGDEFECLVFKTSNASPVPTFQFFAGGRFVEIVGEIARFVPLPMVRQAGGDHTFEYILEFFDVKEVDTKAELKIFFTFLKAILECWDACPNDIKTMVDEQIKKIK